MSIASVEVVYRGVFQRTLAQRLCQGVVLAAHQQSKLGITFGRYGDSPERAGIPAKQFAVIANSEEELQCYLSTYESENNEVTLVLDDTLCKGVESWAWHGLQPITKLTKSGGTLLVISLLSPEELIAFIPQGKEYSLAIVKGTASFSDFWVYKDDSTEARLLGAVAKVAPHLVSLESIEQVLRAEGQGPQKADSARQSFQQVSLRRVTAEQGGPELAYEFELPNWHQMTEALVISAIPRQERVAGQGYHPQRNRYFRNFSSRTLRPVVNFEKCVRCGLCWLHCPDSSFDMTPDGLFDPDMEHCSGCGICVAVCPAHNCIILLHEGVFADYESQWQRWQRDRQAYALWLSEKAARAGAGLST